MVARSPWANNRPPLTAENRTNNVSFDMEIALPFFGALQKNRRRSVRTSDSIHPIPIPCSRLSGWTIIAVLTRCDHGNRSQNFRSNERWSRFRRTLEIVPGRGQKKRGDQAGHVLPAAAD